MKHMVSLSKEPEVGDWWEAAAECGKKYHSSLDRVLTVVKAEVTCKGCQRVMDRGN
ncbi:hypothetical protein LCGC14_0897400 [marine sediment metagenome]|uniref:Uncharacterized protein n=1 Tax=marine sediment metagenome TaxID=412755 RepID=A0A0F9P285_9ZZZZ